MLNYNLASNPTMKDRSLEEGLKVVPPINQKTELLNQQPSYLLLPNYLSTIDANPCESERRRALLQREVLRGKSGTLCEIPVLVGPVDRLSSGANL